MHRSRSIAAAAAVLLVLPGLSLWSRPASADAPVPQVEGPVTGGLGEPFIASTTFDLSEVGYTQAEYFVSGTARSYAPVTPLEADGRWDVEPDESAAYRTRVLVYRPRQRGRFNGTVVVEWLNVSGGLDSAPDWLMTHTELVRRGYAWVGVSAQSVGVEGGPGIIPGIPSMPLKEVDPERYGSLVHPGDSFSYDIFSQVGEALRDPTGVALLGGLRPKRILALGESQSAFRLTTYVNALQPRDGVYDGFFIHSRGAGSAALAQAPVASFPTPAHVFLRTDLGVPVLVFETETDLTLLRYAADRQPDSDGFRLWEVAGTSHADTYTTSVGATDRGHDPSVTELVVTTTPVPQVPGLVCPVPINSGPQHFVANAAIAALERWVRTGRPPAPKPRIELAQPPPQTVIARDDLGNALGGIRTPAVDLPVATLSGEGQTGSILCILFGTTQPFDPATLEDLYPDSCDYLHDFDRSTWRALFRGDVLLPDAWLMTIGARLSGPGADATCGRRHAGHKRLRGRHFHW